MTAEVHKLDAWGRPDPTAEMAAEVARLAALSPLEYDQERTAAAEHLGVRVATLDAEVQKARVTGKSEPEPQGGELVLAEPEVWQDKVSGIALLDELAATFSRYVVLPEHADTLLALWVIMTHAIDVVEVAPILAITSPEKQCGKTTLLEVLARLVRRGLPASNITAAAMFRTIEKWTPTLLVDEADTFLMQADELRGVLNSGHVRATAYVIRCVGDSQETRVFRTWGAKAVAAIGRLPETILDRAIEVRLRRALPGEQAEKIRRADAALFRRLSEQAARWARDHSGTIVKHVPDIPAELPNRAGDNAEPLLAIADIAGGVWPSRARAALLALTAAPEADASLGVQLLHDVAAVFAARGADRLPTKDILESLAADDLKPWATLDHGRQITARILARKLKAFGIWPLKYRDGPVLLRGYRRGDFDDPVRRYTRPTGTPEMAEQAEQPEHPPQTEDAAAYARASRGE